MVSGGDLMLAKCANPECSAVFRSTSEGKVYRTPVVNGRKNADLEHFWLCSACAPMMTMVIEPSGRVVVMRRSLVRPYRDVVGHIQSLPQVAGTVPPVQHRAV